MWLLAAGSMRWGKSRRRRNVPERTPLTRDEVVSVIEGRSAASRVPVNLHFWVHPNTFEEREPQVLDILNRFPVDIQILPMWMPGQFRKQHDACPNFSWLPWEQPPAVEGAVGIDAHVALTDWDRIDEIIASFPTADMPPHVVGNAQEDAGAYRLLQWFFCLFERHWSLRGMTNALMDYYTNAAEVHRLFDALTTLYCDLIERAAAETRCDGLWTSDDLGTQTAPFFSVDIFREFYKPYYARIFDTCHRLGLHAWMHACGDVAAFIPDWIDAGLDVLHPIQKYCMDDSEIAAAFGDKLTIFSGIEVQQVIPWGTPDEVRAEVRRLMDIYWRPGEGRMMFTAGNEINNDCTLASLEALFDEAFTYGAHKATQ